jgi:hypothetical protein
MRQALPLPLLGKPILFPNSSLLPTAPLKACGGWKEDAQRNDHQLERAWRLSGGCLLRGTSRSLLARQLPKEIALINTLINNMAIKRWPQTQRIIALDRTASTSSTSCLPPAFLLPLCPVNLSRRCPWPGPGLTLGRQRPKLGL